MNERSAPVNAVAMQSSGSDPRATVMLEKRPTTLALTERQLTEQLQSEANPISKALEQFRQRSLLGGRDDSPIVLTTRGREDYERLVAAKQAGLRELLAGWNADQQPELQRLVVQTRTRDLVGEIPTPLRRTV